MEKEIVFDREQDEVAIVAPSSGCADAKEKLLMGVKLLEAKGFKCKFDKNILSNSADLDYFASSRMQRVHEIKTALFDPKVRIIWAFRGGYGASEIISELFDLDLQLEPKIIIGFSDITALLLLFHQKFKMPAIHTSVINSLVDKQAAMLNPIISVLSGNDVVFSLEALNHLAENRVNIDARIVGGNLAVVCHMIGSKLTIDTDNRIIFLEDVNEKGYQVHRYLLQMKNSGLFSKARALIIGDFSCSDDKLDSSINSFCREHLTIPAFKTRGIGHLSENYPVVMGANSQIRNKILTITSFFRLI